MDVPPVKPPATLASPGSQAATAPADLPFTLGQQLFAQVVQVLGPSSAIVDLAGQRLLASTPLPVSAGQVLHVAVRSLAPAVELALLGPPVQFSQLAYELAAVLQARQASSPTRLTVAERQSLLAELVAPQRSGVPLPPGSAGAQLAEVLQPIPLELEGDALATRLRHAIGTSGSFVEGKLAGMVARGERDVSALRDDVRLLLARLTSETPNAPSVERVQRALAADALGRQLEMAAHAVRDHEMRLDVAVSVGSTASDVRLRVRDDPPRARPDAPSEGRTVDLTLQLPSLGRVRVTLHWSPGHAAVRFTVEDQAAEAALRTDVHTLTARLTGSGFTHVTTDVAVDVNGVADSPDDLDQVLPGGSILQARA